MKLLWQEKIQLTITPGIGRWRKFLKATIPNEEIYVSPNIINLSIEIPILIYKTDTFIGKILLWILKKNCQYLCTE